MQSPVPTPDFTFLLGKLLRLWIHTIFFRSMNPDESVEIGTIWWKYSLLFSFLMKISIRFSSLEEIRSFPSLPEISLHR